MADNKVEAKVEVAEVEVAEVEKLTVPASDLFGGKTQESVWGAWEKVCNKGLLTAEVLQYASPFISWFETPTGKLLLKNGDNILVRCSGKIFNMPANKERILPLSTLANFAEGVKIIHETYHYINGEVAPDINVEADNFDASPSNDVLEFAKKLAEVS